MRKFTVKDFISYNNPCFSCGDNINLSIHTQNDTTDFAAPLRPTVKQEYTTVNLKVTYIHNLQLQIIHHSNRFASSNVKDLENYLNGHKLYLVSNCTKCYSHVESSYLEFNMEKGFILPVELDSENLIITDEKNRYHVFSSYKSANTLVTVDRIDKANKVNSIRFEAPLLNRARFVNKDRLIDKLKTYMLFS